MFNLFLKIFLFLSPVAILLLSIPCIPALQFYQFGFFGNSIEISQRQLFCYLSILLFFIAMISVQQRMIQDKLLSAIFLICIFSVYIHPRTMTSFLFILFGFLVYFLVSIYANTKNLSSFFKVIAFVSLFNTIFAILQSLNIHVFYLNKGEIIGMMSYKTQLGIYQAIAIPICYSLNPWLVIVPSVGLLLAKSGTGLVVAILGMAYMFRKHLKFIQSPPIWLGVFTLSALFIYKSLDKIMLRVDGWIEAIKQGVNHIWIGNGFGTFKYIKDAMTKYPVEYKDPYSLYLQIFHAVGIFGIIIFLIFLVIRFMNFRHKTLNEEALFISCLIFAISGFVYSFMDYPRLAGTAIVLFGLLTAIRKENSWSSNI